MGQLGQTGHDVADGVDAGFPGLHPLVDADKAALHFDFCRLEADVGGARRAAYGHQHLLRFLHHLLAVRAGEGHLHPVLGLLDFVDLGAGVGVDASLAEDARQFLAHVLVFVGHQRGAGTRRW